MKNILLISGSNRKGNTQSILEIIDKNRQNTQMLLLKDKNIFTKQKKLTKKLKTCLIFRLHKNINIIAFDIMMYATFKKDFYLEKMSFNVITYLKTSSLFLNSNNFRRH